MDEKEKLFQVIFTAIDEVNAMLPRQKRLSKTAETPLLEANGGLDSLGLVNLIVAVEQNLEKTYGRTVSLANEQAISLENSPFKTVRTLADYISPLLT